MDACLQLDKKLHLYSRQHLWFSQLTGNRLVFGISEFYQDQLLDVLFIQFTAPIGGVLNIGAGICVIESAKSLTEISLPFSAALLQINSQLLTDAASINRQPETSAWLAIVQINTTDLLGNFLTADQYQHYLDQ